MHAHDLLVNEATDRHAVEDVAELLPHFDVISPLTFVVETVDAGNGCTFMVSTELEEVLRVLDLVCEHQCDCFETLLASIYIIT